MLSTGWIERSLYFNLEALGSRGICCPASKELHRGFLILEGNSEREPKKGEHCMSVNRLLSVAALRVAMCEALATHGRRHLQ